MTPESHHVEKADGQRGAMLRAFDKATGKEGGAVFMPAYSGELIAYGVP